MSKGIFKAGDRVEVTSTPDLSFLKLFYAPPPEWKGTIVKVSWASSVDYVLDNWFIGYHPEEMYEIGIYQTRLKLIDE